jgi:glycosyltransferase involved in cell wall biosynthesis
MKKKVLLEAPFTASGYGLDARTVYEALKKSNKAEIYILPVKWGNTSWLNPNDPFKQEIDALAKNTMHYASNGGKFDIHVHVGIPNEFVKKAPYGVCVTAGIETTKIAPEWVKKSFEIDKVIVHSEFSKKAFVETAYEANSPQGPFVAQCRCPVDVIPFPMREVEKVDNLQLDFEPDFNFICVAMWAIRKNLENTIKWFVEEFRKEKVGLILKVNTVKNSLVDYRVTEGRLKQFLSELGPRECKVYLLHGELTEQEMNSLYCHPKVKAIVSTTHGEGFGLPLFEATANELPVIAPDWSGQVDFLYDNNEQPLFGRVKYDIKPVQEQAVWKDIIVKDSMWCYPQEMSFKKQIRDCFKDYSRFKSNAKKLCKLNKEKFEKEKILKAISDSIFSQIIDQDWFNEINDIEEL